MSNLPSIDELLKKTAAPSSSSKATPTNDAQTKFVHKMEEIEIKEKEKLTRQSAEELGLPFIDLSSFPVSSEALRVLPEDAARAKKAVCFFSTAEELRLGCVQPTPGIEELLHQLEERHHANAVLYLISEHSLEKILQLYSALPVVKPISKDINISDEELNRFQDNIENLASIQKQFQTISITNVVNLIIASALKVNASDIHVEAEEKGVAVRYRIDGILHDVATLPREQWKQFVSRVKLLAALKINVTDRPQDGRATLRLSSGSLDVRLSTMPTIYGESVVMRILHSGSKGVTLDELGLGGAAYEQFKKEIARPNGMIITTGPTGSGKTTTMYAILRTLNKPGVKIITLEDPVEIKTEGINQSQIDPSKDYTFAKGLRSVLRQDPDICMVGEIRDLETAEIAIQAALTGHLILSTIHTNSASGAIPRFLSMGVKPFLLAPALNAIIGQRLVRRICSRCITEDNLNPEVITRVKNILTGLPENERKKINLDDLRFYRGAGCTACNNLGYKGRLGIFEIFTINKELETVILSAQISEYTIQELAVKNGMITMVQDGLLKALAKITTVEEIFRVTE